MRRVWFDNDLDWWFGCSASFLGERGTTASTMNALERGNASSHGYEEPFSDLDCETWFEQMEKERAIRARLTQLPKAHRLVLEAHYSTMGRRTNHVTAKYGDLGAVMVFLAVTDLHSLKAKELEALEKTATEAIEWAHKAYVATKPDDTRKQLRKDRLDIKFNAERFRKFFTKAYDLGTNPPLFNPA